jgi:transketolase
MNTQHLTSVRQDCLKDILSLYYKANAGHIGASLSCLDILIYLYFNYMGGNDRFVLSKGHAALALYVVLAHKGLIDKKLLESYYLNGTLLAAHPPCNRKVNGIHFGTGSLGHGLSLATGFAFSNRFTKKTNKACCILSEGDCDEGSTWEAALFAGHYKLNNLVVVIDHNNLQGFGKTEEVLNLEPLSEKWRSFNFEVIMAGNGNDFQSIDSAFNKLNQTDPDKPKCIIANTTKGSGVSYMENKLEWHYLPMELSQYEQALKEIDK